MTQSVAERDIFRATKGLALHATLARTLAYCIFWSQYAQHHEGGAPSIWKTGPEMEADLNIAPRTGNAHLKKLAALGYWTLSYRPRPGTIGPVTWLTFAPRSVALLQLAREQVASGSSKRKAKNETSGGPDHDQPSDTATDGPSSHKVTSKQTYEAKKTAGKSFILNAELAKAIMKEALPSEHSEKKLDSQPKAPGYLKVSADDRKFAALVRSAWQSAGLKEWDWTSRFTWTHLAEVRQKMAKCGIEQEGLDLFFQVLLKEWHWVRLCMVSRYAHNDLNLHGPTPMALNHEFDILTCKVSEKVSAPTQLEKVSSLDDDWF
jgi:hypothetical protein